MDAERQEQTRNTAPSTRLDGVFTWTVWAAVAVIPFDSTAVRDLLLALSIVLFLLRRIMLRDWRVPDSSLNLPVASLLLICLVASVLSPEPLFSLDGFRSEPLKYGLFYLLLLEVIRTPRDRVIFTAAVLIPAAILAAVGVPGWLLRVEDLIQVLHPDQPPRAVSLNGNYNYLGLYLVLAVGLAVPLRARLSNAGWKLLLDLGVLLGLCCILLTLTRAVWVAAFVMLVALAFFLRSRTAVIALAALLVLFAVFSALTFERALSIIEIRDYTTRVIPERFPNWHLALQMIRDRPFLGHGTGQRIMSEVYFHESRYWTEDLPNEKPLRDAHNTYLQVLLEIGILGLFALFWLFLEFARVGWPASDAERDTWRARAHLGVVAAALGIWVSGLALHFWNDEISQIFMVLMPLTAVRGKGEEAGK